MSVQNFIPTIWSARLNESLKKNLVYGNVVNTDYEGEIQGQGSTVKINSIGAVTIGNYDKVAGIGNPQELDAMQKTLVIDQAKYFNFQVDDVDAAQANVNLLDGGIVEASYGLANVVDQYLAGFYTEVKAENTMGNDATPITPTKDTAYDLLIDLGVLLDENNVPESERFVVVPAWYYGLLLKDARFTKDPNVIRTGYVGDIDGMTVYKSNNVPNTAGAKYKIIAGHKSTISFAGQVDSVEAFRPEKQFSDAVKGLQVFGAKCIKPEALAVLTANKS
ncbi:P22 phage major capsid protein family protein [Paenibacillus sp. CMAA1739]|uniref:P22 phage major capsid protein family protein n=1 Tax=Paenibacillus ottowii TaxID=2315729 RepID=UPI00272FF518|nr:MULTISPECIES: P22 phage major capsid protein family protein [Paenibacillus]MDP1509341.1 P22 phage major capsid protein family protein [Paenibacillus ottowii]MEC4564532.1 P22 phage major capsid protein family protein [Paenibacillus sp. CMAA1739]